MKKFKALLVQFIKFGFVGGVCFLADFGLMVFLKEVFGVDKLVASAISFTLSAVLNYILSMHFVFVCKEGSRVKEFLVYFFLSIVGLGINQLVMWFGCDIIFVDYRIVKIAATAVVLVYNFISRKLFIEKH